MYFYKIVSDGAPIPLTYSFHQLLPIGSIVIVTIRQREILGIIFEIIENIESYKIKPLTRNTWINIGENLVKFIVKFSEYTLYPSHIFLKSIIPKFYNRNKLTDKNKDIFHPYQLKKPLNFNEEQTIAVNTINSYKNYKTLLLYGTTGSGKTEVSIGSIIDIIQTGGQVLILLPEISLINQWVNRIKTYVDCPVIIYHYLQGKNKTNWETILYQKGIIVVGARSAIFLPFQNLKLIIVDEEHDQSYKQETKPLYSARDGAVLRGFYENCPVVLASATPSLDSLANAESGKYHLITMKNKFYTNGKVQLNFVPMDHQILSEKLLREIKATYLMGKKSIIFINRRGYGNKVKCTNCQGILSCNSCDFCLVYHKFLKKFMCHLCNYTKTDNICPSCKKTDNFQFYGIGVEKVEEFIREKLPDKKTLIFSSDTTGTKKALEEKLALINDNEPSIIIGTQMLTKGHDLSNLSLVIILDLNISNTDFRGREKALQLLTQILGRIGRKEGIYKAFVQLDLQNTFSQFIMDSFTDGQNINYKNLITKEMIDRRQWQLPPYVTMINIYIQHKIQDTAYGDAEEIWMYLHNYSDEKIRLTRPVLMGIPRKKNLWHYVITVMINKKNHNIFNWTNKLKSEIVMDVNPNFIY